MKKLFFTLLLILILPSFCFGADYFDWGTRTDRDGKPAGIFTTTPYPVISTDTTYAITNDEGTTTYTLGTKVYVDDNAGGCSNGDTDYDPVAGTCGAGSDTIYTTLTNALTGLGTGTSNTTILIRDGTYTATYSLANIAGIDNTHRWSIIGYNQERPILDGGNTTSSIFARNDATPENAYITIQRVKIQNTLASGIRWGSNGDKYINLIDVHLYSCGNQLIDFGSLVYGTHDGGANQTMLTDSGASFPALTAYDIVNVTDEHNSASRSTQYRDDIGSNTGTTITDAAGGTTFDWDNGDIYMVYKVTDGNCYYYRNDNGYISHCTFERSRGHGVKIGDGASDNIVEWCVSKENGYWSGMSAPYVLSRTVAIDLPADSDISDNNILRYNIGYDCVSHGLQQRRQNNVSCHHNEIYNFGHMVSDMTGFTGAVTPYGIDLAGGWSDGDIYSNIVRDCDAGSNAPGIIVYACDTGSPDINIYNNLIYGMEGDFIYIASSNTGATIEIYNNSIYGNTTGTLIDENEGAQTTLKNNILYQAGSGSCTEYQSATVNDYNRYYYPSGSKVANADGANDEDATAPDWTSNPAGAWSAGEAEASAAMAGFDLSAVFTTDKDGTVRGTWSKGWDEYSSGGDTTPPVIQNIIPLPTVEYISTTTTVTITWDTDECAVCRIGEVDEADEDDLTNLATVVTQGACGAGYGTQFSYDSTGLSPSDAKTYYIGGQDESAQANETTSNEVSAFTIAASPPPGDRMTVVWQ